MPQRSRCRSCKVHARMHLHAQRLPCMAPHAILGSQRAVYFGAWMRHMTVQAAQHGRPKFCKGSGLHSVICNLHQAPTGCPTSFSPKSLYMCV